MTEIELFPYEERASGQVIRNYQGKIGSLLYAAVTTRIDIAFAVSRLASFLTNPGPEHHAAADRVFIIYIGTGDSGYNLAERTTFW